jgi:hypothetical protein
MKREFFIWTQNYSNEEKTFKNEQLAERFAKNLGLTDFEIRVIYKF